MKYTGHPEADRKLEERVRDALHSVVAPIFVPNGMKIAYSGGGTFVWSNEGAQWQRPDCIVYITLSEDEAMQGQDGSELGETVPVPQSALWAVGVYHLDDEGFMTEHSCGRDIVGAQAALDWARSQMALREPWSDLGVINGRQVCAHTLNPCDCGPGVCAELRGGADV